MFYKRNMYLLLSFLIIPIFTYSQNHEVTPLLMFFRKLSYLMWHSFFFMPKILGALFLGNGTYIIYSFIFFLCMTMIESYCLHKSITTSYKLIIPRMIFINFIDIVVQALAAYPLFYLINLHNYLQDVYMKVYTFYGLTICASIIILICRIFGSYMIYRLFDKTTEKSVLFHSMIKANTISYIFIITAFFITMLAQCNFI